MSATTADRVFEATAALFGLLSTPTRLRIVHELCEGEKNVGELLNRVGARQPNVSQHLGMLYRGGLVARRREGSQMYYRISSQRVFLLCDALCGDAELANARPPVTAVDRSLS